MLLMGWDKSSDALEAEVVSAVEKFRLRHLHEADGALVCEVVISCRHRCVSCLAV